MIDKGHKTNIFAIGTLRVDLYLDYDFSVPMSDMEIKLSNYTRKIGGSVYNTCRFICNCSNDLGVTMYAPNHVSLINELSNNLSTNGINIVTNGKPISKYPMSIVGIDHTGEKRMLSIDTEVPLQNPDNTIALQSIGNFFYSSFYEINENNLEFVSTICDHLISRNIYTMIDLCPLIDDIDFNVISKVLKCISVLSGNKLEYEKLFKIIGVIDDRSFFETFPNIKMMWIKRGSEGAEVKTHDGLSLFKESITNNYFKAKNTTGCGDVFNAIVIIGLISDWSIDKILSEAVKESTMIAERGLL